MKCLFVALTAAQYQGHPVFLASCTLAPIAHAIAEKLRLNGYIASTLAFDENGRATGGLERDVTGNKRMILAEAYPEIFNGKIIAYTDNREDIDLMEAASEVHYLAR